MTQPETIIKLLKCSDCLQEFPITTKDTEFFRKISVSWPIHCPSCRERQRLSFRNERYYYQSSCTNCKNKIISVYNPEFHKNVYCHKCWWSDSWDPKEYGRDFNPQKPFFDQYKELLDTFPKLAMMNDNGTGSENSEYTYDVSRCKNAYLVIGSWCAQDCFYGFQINHVKDCVDNYFVNESALMYNSVMCEKCYNCQDCTQCINCSDCIFCYDLKGCHDCLFCAGLVNKQYYILNKPYSKDEYFKRKKAIQLESWKSRESNHKRFIEFLKGIPHKYANLINCENCTGDNLVNSKDSQYCFSQRNLHSCKFMSCGDGARDCYDCWSTGGSELCYNCITPDESYQAISSIYCWKCKYVTCSENCHFCQNIFGCVGLKRSQYCILNKQYFREEYEKIKSQIIEEMNISNGFGNFFSNQLTSFAYNETPAHEWHPLSKEEALNRGYRWAEKLPGTFEKESINWDKIPEKIIDLPQDFYKHIFPCIECHKNYRIQEKELEFYIRNNLPLPRLCIDCRYNRRKTMLNPRKLWKRKCQKCALELESPYSPERSEMIFCKKCYLENII